MIIKKILTVKLNIKTCIYIFFTFKPHIFCCSFLICFQLRLQSFSDVVKYSGYLWSWLFNDTTVHLNANRGQYLALLPERKICEAAETGSSYLLAAFNLSFSQNPAEGCISFMCNKLNASYLSYCCVP